MTNIDRLREWTAALRSDSYRQTQSVLVRINDEGQSGFCCMGVGCEVMGLPRRPETGSNDNGEPYPAGTQAFILPNDADDDVEITAVPPKAFLDWLDVPISTVPASVGSRASWSTWHMYLDAPEDMTLQGLEEDQVFFENGQFEKVGKEGLSLAELNDSGDFTFSMIADCIDYFGVKA